MDNDSNNLQSPNNLFRDFLFILFCQKRVIIFATLAVISFSIAIAMFWPPTYNTSALIMLKGKKSKLSPDSLDYIEQKNLAITREDLVSEGQILSSNDVVKDALINVNNSVELFSMSEGNDNVLLELVSSVQSKLKVDTIPYSTIITVNFSYKDPKIAKAILDELISVYIKKRNEIFNPGGLKDFLTNQVQEFENFLDQDEQKLIQLASLGNSADPSLEITNNLNLKNKLEENLNNLKIKLYSQQEVVKHLKNSLADNGMNFFSSIQSDTISKLAVSQQALVTRYAEEALIYQPNSPVMLNRQEQIKKMSDLLNKEVNTFYLGALAEMEVLSKSVNELEQNIIFLQKHNQILYKTKIEQKKVEREMEQRVKIVQTFTRRLEEARISQHNDIENLFSITILAGPEEAQSPSFPKPKVIIIFGIISGTMLGCCLAFIFSYFDHSFRRPEDSVTFIDQPTIFSVPYDRLTDWSLQNRKQKLLEYSINLMIKLKMLK